MFLTGHLLVFFIKHFVLGQVQAIKESLHGRFPKAILSGMRSFRIILFYQ
jgi:hypothetical protein